MLTTVVATVVASVTCCPSGACGCGVRPSVAGCSCGVCPGVAAVHSCCSLCGGACAACGCGLPLQAFATVVLTKPCN